jgi:hypothetical protein
LDVEDGIASGAAATARTAFLSQAWLPQYRVDDWRGNVPVISMFFIVLFLTEHSSRPMRKDALSYREVTRRGPEGSDPMVAPRMVEALQAHPELRLKSSRPVADRGDRYSASRDRRAAMRGKYPGVRAMLRR